MPAERPETAPSVPRAVRVLRFAANAIVLAVAFACLLLLLVRFVAFPRIEAHRDDIAAELSARIGQPVRIGTIATGWDGWNPRLSIRGFTVGAAGGLGEPVLDLPRVDLVVSWTSLPALDLRLRELAIEGPRLAVRRDTRGRIHVAGIEIDADTAGDDSRVSDWLLRQPRIVVHDGLVAWTDELRRAPQLVLDHVSLRVEQRFGEHRFGLTGVPPPEVAAPLEVRGEFSGGSLREWQKARGRTYLRLDFADLAAWAEWLPLPVRVDRGTGALRLWFDFADGAPRAITADVELANVRARLGDDVPEVELAHVAGRIAGRQDGTHREITTRALTFASADAVAVPPTDLTLRHDDASGDKPAHGELAVDRLDLAPVSALAGHLPLPARWRGWLAGLAPRGVLKQGRLAWDGPADAPTRYTTAGEFVDVAFAPHEGVPGVTGANGRFDASEAKGRLVLAPAAMTVTLPDVLPAPLALDSLQANVGWTRGADGLEVHVEDARFANADAAGTAAGSWRAHGDGPGIVDVRGHLSRATAEPAGRYLPLALNEHIRAWIARAVVRGTSNDVDLVLRGDLADFPFPDGRGGQFLVAIKGHGATVDYAEAWPQITDVDADVRFEGARLSIDATRGRVLGAAIGRTRMEIPDLRVHPALLRVAGTADGTSTTFLNFLAHSPVGAWMGDVTEGVQASGDGHLALQFEMPVPADSVNATGEYQMINNQVRWPGAPLLAKVNGKIAFTGREVRVRDLAAEALGGPLKLSIQAGGGAVRVTASGNASVAAVRREYDVPLLDRMSGATDWQFSLDHSGPGYSWALDTGLKGVAVDLPVPLAKPAAEVVPLHVARRELPRTHEDAITVDYGSSARVLLHRTPAGDDLRVDRALVLLGKAIERNAEADRPGLWIRAAVPALNVDDWLAWQRSGDKAAALAGAPAVPGARTGPTLEGVDVAADVLQAMGRRFEMLKVSGRRAGDDWRLTLDGREVAGTATWQAPSASQPNGRLIARLARLVPPPAGDLPAWAGAAEDPARAANAANPWPAIDLTAEAFFRRGHDAGRLEIAAEPAGIDWQIRRLALVNDAGRIDAEGVWRGGRQAQTKLDVKVDVTEAGPFLSRLGMPDPIRRAPTTIEGQLAWAGAPSDFDYPSLSGTFRMRTGAGQFLKADPGVGRLLGVLSLQALPRRISLDFRDVFSEGFAFDNALATVRIQNGVMHTDAFHLVGPAAVVDIAGDVDLAHETQQLRVRVQPALSSSVSAGAAALFLANPLLGAAVGAGTLLAQKMLNNPIEQLFSYEYAVSGGWDDPHVQRVSARTPATRLPDAAAGAGAPSPPTVEGKK